MALLIDEIRVGKVKPQPPEPIRGNMVQVLNWQRMIENVLGDGLSTSEIFLINNVSEYYYHTRCQMWDMHKDFPNLAPPFDTFWMEYDPPDEILELEDPNADTAKGGKTVLRNASGLMGRVGMFCAGRKVENKPYDKELLVNTFLEYPNGSLIGGAGISLFGLDKEGRVVYYSPCWYSSQLNEDPNVNASDFGIQQRHDKDIDDLIEEAWYNSICLATIPAYLAISFLHCKNVTTEIKTPKPKKSKLHLRKHGQPLLKYKVLEIEPMKRVLNMEGEMKSQGMVRALHICRGHFKDYREHGLGRSHVKGLWWWDAHVRGKAEHGAVEKIYSVSVPKDEAA
jgi:hypothetical protein